MHSIEDEMYAGGWKCLCASVMLQAVNEMRGSGPKGRSRSLSGSYKEWARQRASAREWVKGGIGAITFEDCCDSLGVSSDRARRLLFARSSSPEQS